MKKSWSHPWYKWAAWVNGYRIAQLQREPLCEVCMAEYNSGKSPRPYPATVVHHKIDFRTEQGDSWELFSDPANHQSLCKPHHDQITARRQGKTAGSDVVPTGAPGKQFHAGTPSDEEFERMMADVKDVDVDDLLKVDSRRQD